jgi:ribosomal protein S18 acetylase RimI-like enzyme
LEEAMNIRSYCIDDEVSVTRLWLECGLVVSQNHPVRDIERKLENSGDWFFVGEIEGEVTATCMVGYDGHRGWINCLAVSPRLQGEGHARRMMAHAEEVLLKAGCPKVNLQVRSTNRGVIGFYERFGYGVDDVVSMGKRLVEDDLF